MYEAIFKYFPVLDFPYCPTKLANHSFLYPEVENIWKDIDKSKKTVSFEDMVHGIDGHDLVTHVVLNGGNIFYLWSQRHQPKLWKTFRSFETLQWIPNFDQYNFFNDDKHTSNINLDS